MQGLVHLYCGDGKGKTTAAVGLAIRAAGAGKRVKFVQFLKDGRSHELAMLERAGITVCTAPVTKFTFRMTADEKKVAARTQQALFRETLTDARRYDLIVFDELIGACSAGMIETDEAARFLTLRPSQLEVVLTGRSPDEKFLILADYVTRMECVKHPYENGIAAREGIEY